MTNQENRFTTLIAKSISDEYLDQIIDLRKTHYYESIFDERYWSGGVYNVEDLEVKNNSTDESSTYILLLDSSQVVVSYARYSTEYSNWSIGTISKLHIIMSSKELIGKKIEMVFGDKKRSIKPSDLILEKIIEDCVIHKSSMIISEICIYPYPNLPSLIFHKNHGFLNIQKPLDILHSQNGDMIFTTLGKRL